MKKLILMAAVAVFGVVSVNAQTSFGAKAGLNIAKFSGDSVEDLSSLTGFYIGGYANIRFSEQFAFQPEVLYSMQGSSLNTTYTYNDGVTNFTDKIDVKSNLNYINIPLMMKYYAYKGVNVEFGPQIGFNISSKFKGSTKSSSNNQEQTINYDEDLKNVKSIDFGLNIGAGYELKNRLNFGVRYGLGLTNIYKDDNSDMKNSVLSFGVGYSFK